MQSLRRRLLQCSLGLPLCLPALLQAKSSSKILENSDFKFVEIKDDIAFPVLSSGDYVLVDTQVNSFQGEGMYFYPDWGQPRAYAIKKERDGALGFYYPGGQERLWSVTEKEGQALFSGQAIKVLPKSSRPQSQVFLEQYSALIVPDYPLIA